MNVPWKGVILSIPGRKKEKDLLLEEKMVLQFEGMFREAMENMRSN